MYSYLAEQCFPQNSKFFLSEKKYRCQMRLEKETSLRKNQ